MRSVSGMLRLLPVACAWLTVAAGVSVSAADEPTVAHGKWVVQTYAVGPPDNPLKGLIPYQGAFATFPHSMEWGYIPWKQLLQSEGVFSWEPLEVLLNDAASRGHQVAFRIYADYPNTTSALPNFLSGVARHGYTDHLNGQDAVSYAPDYDDPRLLRAMLATITALGARYDGDPRIAFITVGFIGFWGEWHTFRPSCACDGSTPTRSPSRRSTRPAGCSSAG